MLLISLDVATCTGGVNGLQSLITAHSNHPNSLSSFTLQSAMCCVDNNHEIVILKLFPGPSGFCHMILTVLLAKTDCGSWLFGSKYIRYVA